MCEPSVQDPISSFLSMYLRFVYSAIVTWPYFVQVIIHTYIQHRAPILNPGKRKGNVLFEDLFKKKNQASKICNLSKLHTQQRKSWETISVIPDVTSCSQLRIEIRSIFEPLGEASYFSGKTSTCSHKEICVWKLKIVHLRKKKQN